MQSPTKYLSLLYTSNQWIVSQQPVTLPNSLIWSIFVSLGIDGQDKHFCCILWKRAEQADQSCNSRGEKTNKHGWRFYNITLVSRRFSKDSEMSFLFLFSPSKFSWHKTTNQSSYDNKNQNDFWITTDKT